MNTEPVLNYHAAKSLLEQSGVAFGVAYSTSTGDGDPKPRQKKIKASKSQLRREGKL